MEEKKIPVVRVLLSHVKEFKKDSILTPIFMILEVAMEMIIPLLMGTIVDIGVNNGDMKSILLIGLVMVLVALVGLWAGIMGGKCGASASTGFARNLRKARPILDFFPGHPTDHRRSQCAECLPDDPPYRYESTDISDCRNDPLLPHQPGTRIGISDCGLPLSNYHCHHYFLRKGNL